MEFKTGRGPAIYIIDAHGYLHRAFHALPRLTTSAGEEVGAVYGFTKFLLRLVKDKKPDYLAVCFDSPEKTFRHEMYGEYKAHRKPTDPALVGQLKMAREVVQALNLHMAAASGYEADDIIATIALKAEEAGVTPVIISSDKDILQMLDKGAVVWTGGSEPPRGEAFVKEKFGVSVPQLADYFSIVGDSSDNIPGVAGLGPKAAEKLLAQFGTLDAIYAALSAGDKNIPAAMAKKLSAGRDSAYLSKKLLQLNMTAPVEFSLDLFRISLPDSAALAGLFKKYEFRELINTAARQANDYSLPPSTSWDETVAAAKSAAEIFIHSDGGFLVLGTSGGKFAFRQLQELSDEDRAVLKGIIKAPVPLKVGHGLKETLRSLNIRFEKDFTLNCFDTMLAGYCLNPSAHDFSFPAVCAEYGGDIQVYGAAPQSLVERQVKVWKLRSALQAKMEEKGLEKLFAGMELPLVPVLLRMEMSGALVDVNCLAEFGSELDGQLASVQKEIDAVSGEPVNLNSPKQLAALLFDRLKIPVVRKNKTGYSTDEEVLTEIAVNYPIAKQILAYREAAKLKSTYVDGLISLVSPETGRVHTTFNQTGTATGRFSSTHPNIQNIPVRTGQGRRIRRAFVAGAGNILMSADYSQVDLRVLAHESGDEALVQAFRTGEDIHTKTACEVFNVAPFAVTADMRRSAKAINFGIIYGQTGIGLSQELKISRNEALHYIEHYFNTYKGVREWIDGTVKSAHENGFVRTLSGRMRYFPEINSTNKNVVAGAERMAVNTVIQGGSADIIKKAMLDLYPVLAGEPGIEMIIQVHDDLVFEVSEADADKAAAIIRKAMENAIPLRVPLLVDIKWGKDWDNMTRYGGQK